MFIFSYDGLGFLRQQLLTLFQSRLWPSAPSVGSTSRTLPSKPAGMCFAKNASRSDEHPDQGNVLIATSHLEPTIICMLRFNKLDRQCANSNFSSSSQTPCPFSFFHLQEQALMALHLGEAATGSTLFGPIRVKSLCIVSAPVGQFRGF